MSMHDPISDMLTRIRNAQNVGDNTVSMPASNFKLSVLKVLQEEGYIKGFEQIIDNNKSNINVDLKYFEGNAVIEKIKRISRPGLRTYSKSDLLPVVKASMGIAIVSTSKGVMTAKSAKAQKLGGEIVCIVE